MVGAVASQLASKHCVRVFEKGPGSSGDVQVLVCLREARDGHEKLVSVFLPVTLVGVEPRLEW